MNQKSTEQTNTTLLALKTHHFFGTTYALIKDPTLTGGFIGSGKTNALAIESAFNAYNTFKNKQQ